MNAPWKKLSGKSVYKSPWIEVFEEKAIRPDGQEGTYSYLTKEKPGIFVIAYDGKGIYMIREYRYPVQQVILQLPAGGANTENHEEDGVRELYEETGIRAKCWKNIGHFFVAPGHETCTITVFLATELDLTAMGTHGQEGDENILSIEYMTVEEVKEAIREGKIVCGITIAALMYFFLHP